MNDLISVIIPVYNASNYLDKCIMSVLNQTYENLEVLLINDGSKDSSLDICYSYEKKDSRVKVITKENEGVSKTRNVGIDNSMGKYLMFVDSDDYLHEKYIEKMYNYLIEKNLSVVTSSMTFVDENYNLLSVYSYKNANDILNFKNISIDLVNTSYFNSVCKMIINSKIIKENKVYFNEKIKFGEDLLFSFNVIQLANNIGYLNFPGYYYLQNNSSMTHKNSMEIINKYVEDNKYVYDEIGKYINDDILINNKLFTKYNFALLKFIKNVKYKEFKKHAINLFNKMFDKDSHIIIKKIDYESKSNYILMKLLNKKHYFIYYLVAKTYYSFKK